MTADIERYEEEIVKGAAERVLATPEGREFAWWLIYTKAGLNAATFTSDDRLTAYAEGKRAVGRAVREFLFKVNPELCLQMEMEANKRALDRVRTNAQPQKGLRK